jgi:hypothetical protein
MESEIMTKTIGNRPAYDVVLRNSSGGELDRKSGDDLKTLLREMADEGCLSGGDTITIIDYFEEDDEPEDHRDAALDSQGYSF